MPNETKNKKSCLISYFIQIKIIQTDFVWKFVEIETVWAPKTGQFFEPACKPTYLIPFSIS